MELLTDFWQNIFQTPILLVNLEDEQISNAKPCLEADRVDHGHQHSPAKLTAPRPPIVAHPYRSSQRQLYKALYWGLRKSRQNQAPYYDVSHYLELSFRNFAFLPYGTLLNENLSPLGINCTCVFCEVEPLTWVSHYSHSLQWKTITRTSNKLQRPRSTTNGDFKDSINKTGACGTAEPSNRPKLVNSPPEPRFDKLTGGCSSGGGVKPAWAKSIRYIT